MGKAILDYQPRDGAPHSEIVLDYPHGFTARCAIRYMLEFKKGRGTRLVSQTSRPIPGQVKGVPYAGDLNALRWNKPKASTYSGGVCVMFLDEENHVTWASLKGYDAGPNACREFLSRFDLPEDARKQVDLMGRVFAKYNPDTYAREAALLVAEAVQS